MQFVVFVFAALRFQCDDWLAVPLLRENLLAGVRVEINPSAGRADRNASPISVSPACDRKAMDGRDAVVDGTTNVYIGHRFVVIVLQFQENEPLFLCKDNRLGGRRYGRESSVDPLIWDKYN